MAMIFLFLDLCTATVFTFCCRNHSVFRRRFWSFFRSQDVLIMIVTVLLTLLSLPLWLYILTIIPQENKRHQLYLVVNLRYTCTVPPRSLNAMSTKLIWLYMNSSWGYFSLEALITGGMDIRGDVVVQTVISFSHMCTHRDTYTEICCCCHLQMVITDSLIFSTFRTFLINILDIVIPITDTWKCVSSYIVAAIMRTYTHICMYSCLYWIFSFLKVYTKRKE